MTKKVKRRDVDTELLESIFILEGKWKHIRSIMKKSIEPQEKGIYEEQIARANYMFLLREARYRNISAIRYK
ncbi:MAG TPA: YaaL family protein [Bacillota bacterium]|nr:YaaL family protein [Bacillota bacterium]